MAVETVGAFAETIRALELLDAAQLTELDQLSSAGDDPRTFARAAVDRGWVTNWQAQNILKGFGLEMRVGSYLLMEFLGEGGMGRVFKARHRLMGRIVALKVIRKDRLDNADAVRRFQREIRTVAQLQHPNIALAFDADQVDDRHYFVMEYVEGADLSRLVREKGPLPVSDAVDYIRQAAIGLQHAFERGMVHRDIKPSNLLLTVSREEAVRAALSGSLPARVLADSGPPRGVIKVLDLGLARVMELASGQEPSRLTREGLVIGTPDFLAPEQARNASKVDVRADIYGLGCTLFYLLTSQVPYPGGTPTEKLLKHAVDPIPSARGLRADVPEGLATLIARLMAKRPEQRPATPADLAAALAPFGPDAEAPRIAATDAPPNAERAPSSRLAWIALAVGLTAIVVGALLMALLR